MTQEKVDEQWYQWILLENSVQLTPLEVDAVNEEMGLVVLRNGRTQSTRDYQGARCYAGVSRGKQQALRDAEESTLHAVVRHTEQAAFETKRLDSIRQLLKEQASNG